MPKSKNKIVPLSTLAATIATTAATTAIKESLRPRKTIVKRNKPKKPKRKLIPLQTVGNKDFLYSAPVNRQVGNSGPAIEFYAGSKPGRLGVRACVLMATVFVANGTNLPTVQNHAWNANYGGTSIGNLTIPFDPNVMSQVLAAIFGTFTRYRFRAAALEYRGCIGTQNAGSLVFGTSADPNSGAAAGTSPAYSNVANIEGAEQFPIWIACHRWDVSKYIDLNEKYMFNTSATSVDDNRLSCAGQTLLSGLGIATVGADTTFGAVYGILDFEAWNIMPGAII